MSDPNQPPPPPGGMPPGGPPQMPPPPGGTPPPPGGMPPGGMPPPPGGGGYGGGFTPPPAQPYGGAGGVPPLDVGAAVSYGWTKFKQYPVQFILLVLGIFVVQGIWSGLISPILQPNSTGFIALLISLALSGVGLALSFVLEAGVWRASLGVTKGEEPSVGQFLQSDNFAPFALTAIVVGLGAAVGFLLCILPGIAWLIFTAYAPILAIDKGMGPGEAISTSINYVKSNFGTVFLLLLVAWLLGVAGIILCCIGILVTYPISRLAIVHSYRALNGEPVVP